MSHRVFLSYSKGDVVRTEAICKALEDEGINCWMAPRDIPPGAAWAGSIIEAISSSEALVLVFSSHSNASVHVKREVDRAINKNIPILTFRITEDTPVGEMEFYLATSQWLDASTGEFSEHLQVLVDTIKSGDFSQLGAAIPNRVEVGSLERVLEEVKWAVAEIEASEGPVDSSRIDRVFDAALDGTAPIWDAGLYQDCGQIYLLAAEGVLGCLEDPNRAHAIHYASHIEAARRSLQVALAEVSEVTPDNAIGLCNTLRTIFKDFVDRVDEGVPELKTRWAVWGWTIVMLAIATTSTFWAYAVASHAWQLQFSYFLGVQVGSYLEVARSVVLAAMMLYLLEVTFRTESGRFFDLTRADLWRSRLVVVMRIAMLAFTVFLVRSVILYHLHDAPENLMQYAQDQLKENQELSSDDRRELELEKDDIEKHRRPYRPYLGYSLVNYVGLAVPLMFVTLFSVGLDARELTDERKACLNAIGQIRGGPDEIDRAFEKFYNVSQRKSRRYLILFAWIAGSVAIEQLVTKVTLARSGLVYEFLASLVIGLATLIWIGFLCHFYEGVYQRCHAEKRRRGVLTDQWENSRRTVKFLFRCVFNHVGGIFALLYVWPFLLAFSRWTTRH